MTSLLIGDPQIFAIESCITQAYARLSQRALGFFVIHIGGKSYGVRKPEASLLANSLDAVQRRIERRGMHAMKLGGDTDALQLAEAIIDASYHELSSDTKFFGMLSAEFHNALLFSEVLWAPDGDAAFDDGSHVLHFDVGDQVRLIAFVNPIHRDDLAPSLNEVWIPADAFYACLDSWQRQFVLEWKAKVDDQKPMPLELKRGDIFHAEAKGERPDRRPSAICIVTNTTPSTIEAIRITTHEHLVFDRSAGKSVGSEQYTPFEIDSVAELPYETQEDVRRLFEKLKPGRDLDDYKLTPQEMNLLLFLGKFYRANPVL